MADAPAKADDHAAHVDNCETPCAYAWLVWGRWRGDVGLVARIARVAEESSRAADHLLVELPSPRAVAGE
jgi:hypothetical protein